VKTESEMNESIKKLYHLADKAVRTYVQMELQNEQEEAIEQEQLLTEEQETSGIQLIM
jgi:hypothetical protein